MPSVTVPIQYGIWSFSVQITSTLLPLLWGHVTTTSLSQRRRRPRFPPPGVTGGMFPFHFARSLRLEFPTRAVPCSLKVCPWNLTSTPVSSIPRITSGIRHLGALFRLTVLSERAESPNLTSAHSNNRLCAEWRRDMAVAISFRAVSHAIIRNFLCHGECPDINVS